MVLGKALPSFIEGLPAEDHKVIGNLLQALTEVREAPSEECPRRIIYCGRPPLVTRFIPEGIMPLDQDDGFEHDVKLQKFYDRIAPDKVIFWGIGYESEGVFRSSYDANLRNWIKSDLLHSPVCVIAPDVNVVMITDEILSYTTICGPLNIIGLLDENFGGQENLKRIFDDYIVSGDLGFGQSDCDWALKYLQ